MKQQLPIEMAGAVVQAEWGTVKFFKAQEGWGYVEIPGDRDVRIETKNAFAIVPGKDSPEFSIDKPTWTPRPGNQIVFLRGTGRQSYNAWYWGFGHFYDKAVLKIADRPRFRVMGENRFKGQMMRKDLQNEVVETGTSDSFAARFPRGKDNDPLGPKYVAGPCTRINRWERYNPSNGQWEGCGDPRPLPQTANVETAQP